MMGTLRTLALTLALTCTAGILNAQAPAPQSPDTVSKQLRTTVPPVPIQALNTDAREVQNQLREMFQQYPPQLRTVLQSDPTLLNNAGYLATYPGVAAFVAQHPEIAHNPAYFLGLPNDYREYRDSVGSNIERAVTPLAVSTVIIVLIYTLGLLIRGIINHRRWLRMSKLQTDTQTKLLDRFGSNEELLTFIQTPAGKRFLESASLPYEAGPRSVSAPVGRILWSIQLGIVALIAGGGLNIVSYRFEDADAATGFQVAGVLVIALGIGFILSSLGSYILSRRLGLLDPTSTTTSTTS
ncbi:MAG TPA: hypothetical protein VK210_00375 [Terriglobia bacterium]|nr:hypothetical protein [Terriglobia bacterium]